MALCSEKMITGRNESVPLRDVVVYGEQLQPQFMNWELTGAFIAYCHTFLPSRYKGRSNQIQNPPTHPQPSGTKTAPLNEISAPAILTCPYSQ